MYLSLHAAPFTPSCDGVDVVECRLGLTTFCLSPGRRRCVSTTPSRTLSVAALLTATRWPSSGLAGYHWRGRYHWKGGLRGPHVRSPYETQPPNLSLLDRSHIPPLCHLSKKLLSGGLSHLPRTDNWERKMGTLLIFQVLLRLSSQQIPTRELPRPFVISAPLSVSNTSCIVAMRHFCVVVLVRRLQKGRETNSLNGKQVGTSSTLTTKLRLVFATICGYQIRCRAYSQR